MRRHPSHTETPPTIAVWLTGRVPPALCVYSKAANGKMMLYESFAQATALGDLHTCLMMDMKACQEDDVRLLCYLTPSIYSEVRTTITC